MPARPAGASDLGSASSAEAERARSAALGTAGLHLRVSRAERRIRLMDGSIVLHEAPVAVGKGGTLEHEGQRWEFSTPVGERKVLGKQEDPVWIPPDWHYVELARERGLELVWLGAGKSVALADGSRVLLDADRVVRQRSDGTREGIPIGEEILFGDTLVVPPIGSANRRIPGELGRYKLDLGSGYLIHGTPREETVGGAVTHGCIRLREEDLRRFYLGVPVGTRVFIY